MLEASMQIQKPSKMFLKEGILANNTILSYDEFKAFLAPQLITQMEEIETRLRSIQSKIYKNKKQAYIEWEQFESSILANTNYNVSMLFIDNIVTPSEKIIFQYNSSEQNIMGQSGRLNQLQNLKQELFNANISDQIADHLQEFIGDVDSYNIGYSNALKVLTGAEGNSDMRFRANQARHRQIGASWTYKYIIYGSNPQYKGNVADAFMNHFAGMHAQILAASINNLNIEDQQLFYTSVFNEEKENIWNLLINSTNHTPWFSGGDIIMKLGDQVYNIQLKTGLRDESNQMLKKRKQIGGKLAMKRLDSMITDILNNLKDPEKIIQIFYNELQTSGYLELTETVVENNLNNLFNHLT